VGRLEWGALLSLVFEIYDTEEGDKSRGRMKVLICPPLALKIIARIFFT
jgi:hypothetical protein